MTGAQGLRRDGGDRFWSPGRRDSGWANRWPARAFPIDCGLLNRETSEIESEIRKLATPIPRKAREIDGPAQTREILLLAA